jgi:hypothetical protein
MRNHSFSINSLISGLKYWWKNSVNNTAETHALRLCCQRTGRNFFYKFLRARGFSARWTTPTFTIRPAELPRSTSIGLSFHALNPSGHFFCTLVTIGPVGHILPKQACLLIVKKNLTRTYFPSLTNYFFNSAGNLAADSSSADEAASPVILMFLRLTF